MLSAASPFSLVIFGASGHLAQLKLYPSLFILAAKKRLPEQYNVVGFSRSEMDDDSFRSLVEASVREHVPEPNEKALKEFLSHVHYHQGQYDVVEDFAKLNETLESMEKGWNERIRLAYYSVPPSVFGDISHNLCAGNVHQKDIAMRCIVEKPVGKDLESFEEVKKKLLGCFKEDEIYLLDHYLGKEAVRNVYYLRYANPLLEHLFEHTLIHHIEITAAEYNGIEGRAGYFEHSGTFRDMFQSHLLMIMSLLSMQISEEGESFRKERHLALSQLYLPPADDLGEIVLRGQYTKGVVNGETVPGYLEEEGVEENSTTNTYATLHLLSRTEQWEGVPIYLRSGKRLEKKETRISLVFQEPRTIGKGAEPNRLDIIMQGEAGMRVNLQTKMGGTEPEFRPLILSDPLVCVGDCLPEHSLLILEAIHGKQQWFLSFNEVQTAWRLVDPLQEYLDHADTPLYEYAAGSEGPKEAEDWIGKDGISWIPIT